MHCLSVLFCAEAKDILHSNQYGVRGNLYLVFVVLKLTVFASLQGDKYSCCCSPCNTDVSASYTCTGKRKRWEIMDWWMSVINEFHWFSEKLHPPEGLMAWLLQAQNRTEVTTSWKNVPGAKVSDSINFKLVNRAIILHLCARWHVAQVQHCLATMTCNVYFVVWITHAYGNCRLLSVM